MIILRNTSCLLTVVFLWHTLAFGQIHEVDNPSIAYKSHSEINLDKIIFYSDSTLVLFTITNQLQQGGWICVDSNTFIEDAKGNVREKILDIQGISWCPQVHRFSRVGEILRFKLIFPKMPNNLNMLNILEECERACFEFKGIILDEKLNKDIRMYDEGMDYYVNNRLDEALKVFSKVLEELPPNPTHVYGYSFYNIIRIYWHLGNKEEAKRWLEKLEQSGLPNRQYFLENVKKEMR